MPQSIEPKRWYLPDEAAEYIGSGKSTLAVWRMHNTGPAYSQWDRTVVYDVADLDQWVAGQRVETKHLRPEEFRALRKAGKGTRQRLPQPRHLPRKPATFPLDAA